MTIDFEDFMKVDIRVGRITRVEEFPEARKPAWKLFARLRPRDRREALSAQITNYAREELQGSLVVAVVNFPPRRIGRFGPRCSCSACPTRTADVILLRPTATTCRVAGGPDRPIELRPRATGASPMTFRRRSSAFIAKARVSSMEAPKISVSPSTYHLGWSTASAIGATSAMVRVIASP